MTYTLQEITKEALNELIASNPKASAAYQILQNTNNLTRKTQFFTILDKEGNFAELLGVDFYDFARGHQTFTFELSNHRLVKPVLFLLERYIVHNHKRSKVINVTIIKGACDPMVAKGMYYNINNHHFTKQVNRDWLLTQPNISPIELAV